MAIRRKQKASLPSSLVERAAKKNQNPRKQPSSKTRSKRIVIHPTPPPNRSKHRSDPLLHQQSDGEIILADGDTAAAPSGISDDGSSKKNGENTSDKKNSLFEGAKHTMGKDIATATKRIKAEATKFRQESDVTMQMLKQFQVWGKNSTF